MSGLLHDKASTIMKQAMDEVTTNLEGIIPEELKIVFEKYKSHAKTEILNHALKVGDTMPDFLLPDTTGNLISSIDLRSKGPIIITFIRGDWCPYCHTTINILNEYNLIFKARGANLVAISPQSVETSRTMSEKAKLSFPLLSDIHCKYAQCCDIAFELDDDFFQTLNSVVPEYNGHTDDWLLPVPATFVVDGTDRKILYAFMETEIWKRAEPSNIMMSLPPLRIQETLNTMTDQMEYQTNLIKSTLTSNYVDVIQEEIKNLKSTGIEMKAIQVGHTCPSFELRDVNNVVVKSKHKDSLTPQQNVPLESPLP